MDTQTSWRVFTLMTVLILVQAVASWSTGWLTPSQLRSRRIMNGYSFFEHGGMWADAYLVSYVVARWFGAYEFESPLSPWGLLPVVVTGIVVLAFVYLWEEGSETSPDHCAQYGRTVFAGWVHAVYFGIALWTGAQFYLGWTTPVASRSDLIWLTAILTPWCALGVMKFSSHWHWTPAAIGQAVGLVALLWGTVGYRIWRS